MHGNIAQTENGGANAPVFSPLSKVQCISASDTKQRKRNMRWCMVPGKFKKINEILVPNMEERGDIAIIAGGPSLNETYKDIPKGMHTMSCGSSHDHVIKLGINPTYHIECDPHYSQVKMYREVPQGTKYLLSTRCSKSMFDRLKGRDIYIWNMWESDLGKPVYRGEPAFVCGATVALSAIPLALVMQYRHLHFFGMDSSFPSRDNHHAYPQPENAQMIQVRVGHPETGKLYETTATWAGQAQQFEDMRNHWRFECTIYGDSLTAEIERIRKIEQAKQQPNQTGVAA